MVNPPVRRSINGDSGTGQARSRPLPLVTRRFAAWALEVSLIITSGLLPFTIGIYAKYGPSVEQVPLNPVLRVTEEALARTLEIPINASNRNVPPLTNLFWSAALVAPLVLTGWQLYLLAKTGSTLPKRWFGVRVVTTAGNPPGLTRVLLRETIGSWGLPLSIAYLLWRYSGGFPDLGFLAGLSGLMVLGEGMSARFHRQRRCLHDRLAGTYVVDAKRTFVPLGGRLKGGYGQPTRGVESYRGKKANGNAVSTGVVVRRNWWKWLRQHPSLILLLVALFSMAAVLGTLVGTQVYIQTQENHRQEEKDNSEQFLTLVRQLNLDSPATLDDRQRAILAMGTLEDPQAMQLLVDLLGQQTERTLLDTIQQALASTGPKALPYLQRLNQSFSTDLESLRYTGAPHELALRAKRLQTTQQAIAKILVIYSGKVHNVDLSRTNLGQIVEETTSRPSRPAWLPFTLVLDQIDLSGIRLTAANLNQASFQGSRFRGAGEDGRWDTFDDWITDLNDAQMKEANLRSANLSRVLMNRINLSRATLNQANLSSASLIGANLSSAQLVGANLRATVLTSASLTGANLDEANLSQANLYAARLSRVSGLGTHLQSANLTQSDWQGADLSGADLSYANLHNADLSYTRLTGTNFRNAQLENANLHNADLSLADLRRANLAGANLQGAIFIDSKPPQSNQFIQMPASDSQSALVEGVDFTKAKNLDVRQLAYICTQGGRHPRCP